MDKETRDLISLLLLMLLVVSWVSYAGYTVWKDRQLRRDSEALKKRLTERVDLARWDEDL